MTAARGGAAGGMAVTNGADGAPERGILGWGLVAAGIGVLAWSIGSSVFRPPPGDLVDTVGVVWASGIGLVAVGLGWRGAWRRAAAWFVVGVVGQAASLQLMVAGPGIGYQHYRSVRGMIAEVPVATAIVLLQAALVLFAILRRRSALATWIAQALGKGRAILIAALVVMVSAVLSRALSNYLAELALASGMAFVHLATWILFAWALPRDRLSMLWRPVLGNEATTGDTHSSIRPDRLAVTAAIWVTILALGLTIVVYQQHPHIPDEVVYLLHGEYLASGMWWVPAWPMPGGFELDLIAYDAHRWYSPVPPGWPAMLAIGSAIGVPWAVNPVLAGVNVLLAFMLVAAVYNRRTARLTALLLAASPWHVFMAMNLMTHTFTLTCALIGAVAVAHGRRRGGVGWFFLGGGAVGMVSLIRPLEGLAVALLLGLWSLAVSGWGRRLASAAAFGAGAALIGGLVLPYNRLMTGDATTFPIMLYLDQHYAPGVNALGFGPNRGLGWPGLDPLPGHGMLDVLVNAALNTASVNTELLGWGTGSLLLVFLIVVTGKLNRADGLMLGAATAIVGIHSFYWFSGGPDFGARYWFLILVPLLGLTARGLHILGQLVEPNGGENGWARVGLTAGAMCLAALVCFVPWRSLDKYRHYRGMRPDIRELASTNRFGHDLVLIRGERFPDYASAAVYNPLRPEPGTPLYAWDRSAEVRSGLLEAFPDRTVWLVDGPSLTAGRFEVRRGPLAKSDVPPNPPPATEAEGVAPTEHQRP